MIAFVYLGVIVFLGDVLARRWFSFVSVPHRLATAILVGLLVGTWTSYLAALALSGTGDPLALGGIVGTGAMVLVSMWLRRRPAPTVAMTPGQLRTTRSDWLMVLLIGAIASWMMVSTYNYDSGTLRIAGDLWSDFGPTTAISQSFALGDNFPTEYPHYAGQPIRYHFLYYFQVGNLTYLGLDPATANNVLSVVSMVAMLVVVAALGERLFGSRLIGWIGAMLFFAHGALSFIPYLGSFSSFGDAIAALPGLNHFLASGFPYRGEEWGIWTQDVFLNQRHLPSAIGIVLVIVLFLIDRLSPDARGVRERLATTISRPVEAVRATLRDPWLPGYALCGLFAGLLPLYNGAMFIGSAAVLGILFVVFPNRPQMVVLAIAAAIPALPQLLFLRPGTMAGQQTYPSIYWGYTIDDPTPIRIATYLAFIFGPKLILAGVALLIGNGIQRRVFLAFAGLVGVAFLVQLSVEVLANHKFINTWLIVANLFVAYGLVRLWNVRPAFRVPTRFVALGLTAVIVAGGAIDLIPIKNQRMYQVGLDGDPLFEWIQTQTRPDDVFLSDIYVVHGILEAGRRLYMGWPYYAWSAGYAVGVREQWYRDVFALRSPRELVARLQAEGIAYVAFDDGLRDRGYAPRLNEELFRSHLAAVFTDPGNRYGHLTIYQVPPDPGASAALPDAAPEDMYVGGLGSEPGHFDGPRGIALDRSGVVYVADAGNDRVQAFSSSGNLLRSYGESGSGPGQLDGPTGVAVDSKGWVHVAAGARLLVFDPIGSDARELRTPDDSIPNWSDVAIDREDRVFALDRANARLVRFDPDGTIVELGSSGIGDGQLREPSGVAVLDGTVVVADTGNARIVLFDSDGTFLEAMPVDDWVGVAPSDADVALGSDGTIWASSPTTHSILVYRSDGTLAGLLAPGDPNQLDGPAGLAVRPGGAMFVTNRATNRIVLLTQLNP